jgi:hypothetical protein
MYVLDAKRMAEPHTGTITFLFTDVEAESAFGGPVKAAEDLDIVHF